jgi:hypothetical protein
MRKKVSVALALIVLACLAFALAGASAARRSRAYPLPVASQHNEANVEEDTRPLKEKAKQGGRFVETHNPNRATVCADLSALANRSDAVIIGTPQKNMSNMTPDGKSIMLDYTVKVEYVYKGALREGDTITVSLPGGKVMFEDGSTAEVRTPWFKKMENGKTYALFLSPNGRSGSFVTTGEAQGLFEIPTTKDSSAVKTHSGLLTDPMWKYHNTDVKAFLRELRRATKK